MNVQIFLSLPFRLALIPHKRFWAIAVGVLGSGAITTMAALSLQLPDGTVIFEKSPRLLDAITTFREVNARSAKYYFTLSIPADAGEPLGKVTIAQRSGAEQIDFRVDESFAFVGYPNDRGEELPLAQASWDESTKSITVVFAEPVAPGTTLSVGLKPRRNPDLDGTYLFGVTAFPFGEKSDGLYLGPARLDFDRPDLFGW